MIGKRSAQRNLFEADNQFLDFVGQDTFYGFLALQRGKLFKDEDFGAFYAPDNGRPSVAPSLLATALLLQTYDGVSDEEAKARADYDLRWKVALGIGIEEQPFAKSTLQLFRANLILKEKMRVVFQQSLAYARESGYLKQHRLTAIVDTTYILGRGAVKDTYNLLADGIRQLMRTLAEVQKVPLEAWSQMHGLERYLASSLKGEAQVDWDVEEARQAFLQGIVTDADRLLALRQTMAKDQPQTPKDQVRIEQAASLLDQLIDQDVERSQTGVQLKQGVAKDRILSVNDPQMRHGHKSSSKRFDGHKAAVAVDAESQLVTAVEVLPGNGADATPALSLTEASEVNTGLAVAETVGDCAFGDGNTRQAFADAKRSLIAKVANVGRHDQIHKSQFHIDLEAMTCTCPTGQTTANLITSGSELDKDGNKQPGKSFAFSVEICANCPLRPECVRSKVNRGRTIHLHPQEGLLQVARALQHSPAFQPYRKLRQTVEHRQARLVQLGIRQARYVGREKTLFQVLMAATVANLTLITTKLGLVHRRNVGKKSALPIFSALWNLTRHLLEASMAQFKGLHPLAVTFCSQMPGFRPGF
jgi:hypothetical protein